MPTQGPNALANLSDDGTVGTVAWTSPTNATSSNNVYASCSLGDPGFSHYLLGTNPGFTVTSPPTQVQAFVERKCAGGFTQDLSVKLVVGGSIVGAEKASVSVWPTSDGTATYTWSASELLALGVTAAVINASTFGFVVSCQTSPADTCSIDFVSMSATFAYSLVSSGLYQAARRVVMGNH